MTTVVLGVGNTLLTDEGVGVHVVERLRRDHPALDAVEYLDGGTLSFTLAGPMAEADELIIIDAAELKAVPGTVTLFEEAAMDDYLGRGKRRSVHEVSLLDLLAIAHLTDSLPARRALIGIQPQELGWGDTPSPVVAAAIPRACTMALDLIRKWRQ
ncbi:HyaD/HybD family hydrogenase maturation endopeptidase [Sulfurivermis fontis]|uniref:HyaD/HybD family hydrogenase maturation endopeptidase n=1 Tax=Sulfurivermis fontis TaxID=1972068 RepID=UPI000FD75825|nr:HyaD/HybD family hydrogenase maturation endopeptidase [Sulfurivermis fontis]